MLFITRRSRESLMIGDDIEVFVVSVRGDTVRIGIEAPGSTGIFRKEVYLEIESAGKDGDSAKQVKRAKPSRRANARRT